MRKTTYHKDSIRQIKGCLFCLSSLPRMHKKIIFLFLMATALVSFSQETINQRIEGELNKLYKEEYSRKKEIKIDGKKYRIYNNYVTVGAGRGYNTGLKDVLFTPAVD